MKLVSHFKTAILFLSLTSFSSTFAAEYVEEFYETYRNTSCDKSREAARERVLAQLKSKSDIYAGPVKKYETYKIVRFIQTNTGCEVLWNELTGKLYDYRLSIQVVGK